MGSAKSDPSAAPLDKFLAQGQAHMPHMPHSHLPICPKWANDYDVAQLQVQRYAFRNVWTQFVANLTSFWPMGKWAYDHDSAHLQA